MKKYDAVRLLCFVLIFCLLFHLVSAVLRDKRVEGEYNPTTKIKGFYKEERNSLDFVFIGSSQLYAHIAPAVLWQEYGITSYDFAANEQPLWVSYYYIKEALKYQKPKAIVLEVFTVYGEDYEEEGGNHINLDDLPLSVNKLRAIHDSVPRQLRSSFYFDLAKYHSTWSSLDKEKYEATFRDHTDPMKGYSPFVFLREYAPAASEEVVSQSERAEIPPRARQWLVKIIDLTRREGVDLIFLKTPNGNAERQKLYNDVARIAESENIPFLNLNTVLDGEAHINVPQAKKVTEAVGEFLASRYEIPKRQSRKPEVCESFDASAELFERYENKCELIAIDDFTEYMTYLAEHRYVVFGCQNYYEGQDNAQIFARDGDRTLFEEALDASDEQPANASGFSEDEAAVQKELSLYGMEIRLTAGETTEIVVDGHDYSMHKNGLNLLVYDPILGEMVERVFAGNTQDGTLFRD